MYQVLVDVYPWAVACGKAGGVVMEGVFRHGDFLARKYAPAIAEIEGGMLPTEGIRILEEYLGKSIHVAVGKSWDHVSDDFKRLKVKIWISLALDFVCPLICRETPFLKATIVHDMLAAEGEFGVVKAKEAFTGVQWNTMFAYVSITTLHSFLRRRDIPSGAQYVPYGCFHAYAELPELFASRPSNRSLSVHSIYRRKNLHITAKLVKEILKTEHFHVGRYFGGYTDAEWFHLVSDSIRWLGPLSDSCLETMYRQSAYFVSMTEREGFNMPPMEAVLNGVPNIYLADCLVNREIYGHIVGVAFISLSDTKKSNVVVASPISKESREQTYEMYKKEKVVAKFVEEIENAAVKN